MQFLAVCVPFTDAVSLLLLHVSGSCLLAEAGLCPGLEIKSQTPLSQGGTCILTMTLHSCVNSGGSPLGRAGAPFRGVRQRLEAQQIPPTAMFPSSSSLCPVPGGSAHELTLVTVPRPWPLTGAAKGSAKWPLGSLPVKMLRCAHSEGPIDGEQAS